MGWIDKTLIVLFSISFLVLFYRCENDYAKDQQTCHDKYAGRPTDIVNCIKLIPR